MSYKIKSLNDTPIFFVKTRMIDYLGYMYFFSDNITECKQTITGKNIQVKNLHIYHC